MDKRKNNGGHSTKSTKATDKRKNQYKEALDQAGSIEKVAEVLDMLYNQAVNTGSTRAAKIYLEYYLGKPVETKDISIQGEMPLFPDV